MANPSQMFDHTLDACKGWFHEAALDHSAKLNASVTVDPVEQGRVVHLDADGTYSLGVTAAFMPIFLLNSSDDPDVANPGGEYWQAVAPTGKLSGLVATGGYELESSEFIVTGLTYAPGQYLSAMTGNDATASGAFSNEDDTGPPSLSDLTTGTALVNPMLSGGATNQACCGTVSAAVAANSHGIDVLRFWPAYIPGVS